MPLALTFAFKMEMGLTGLWLGFTIASIILDIGFFFIIKCTDWEQVAYLMSKKLEKEETLRRQIIRTITIPNNR